MRSLNQAGQDVVQIIDRKGVVHPEVRYRALGPKPVSIPQLHLRVSLTAEQHHLTLAPARYQHQYCIRLLKARQIEEIAVLSKGVLRVTTARDFTCARNNGDAVLVHHGHQVFTPTGEFSFRDLHCQFPVMIALR